MVTIIFYLVLIGGLCAAVFGVIHSHDNGVRAKEAELWKPKLEAAQKDVQTAVDANKTLQDSVAKIDAERQACSKGVDALQAAGAQADKAKAQALVTAGTKIGELTRDRDRLESLLSIPAPFGETCDEKMAKIHDELATVATRRMRYNPGTTGGVGGKDAPPGKNPGPDTLRIGK